MQLFGLSEHLLSVSFAMSVFGRHLSNQDTIAAKESKRPNHRSRQVNERYWVIKFEDAEVEDLVFTDEEAATKTYEMKLNNWNCTLFMEVALHQVQVEELQAELKQANEAIDKMMAVEKARVKAGGEPWAQPQESDSAE